MQILSISGGDLKSGETLAFDRLNVELAGKSQVHALFIPTASGDAPGYMEIFKSVYQGQLGCKVDNLLLCSRRPSASEIAEKLDRADIIYVGGGNTLAMMRTWRRYQLDLALKNLLATPKVLTGLSAGAICWHQWGHSDSRGSKDSEYCRVTGLGFQKGMYSPHFDTEHREADLMAKVKKYRVMGLGCDEHTAILYTPDNKAVVKTAKPGSKVRLIYPGKGGIKTQDFCHDEDMSLLQKSASPI